jgi:hypothetical protein
MSAVCVNILKRTANSETHIWGIKKMEIKSYAVEAIEAADIDIDEFVAWVANEWCEGVCQTSTPEVEDAQYDHAVVYINEMHNEIINDYITH